MFAFRTREREVGARELRRRYGGARGVRTGAGRHRRGTCDDAVATCSKYLCLSDWSLLPVRSKWCPGGKKQPQILPDRARQDTTVKSL